MATDLQSAPPLKAARDRGRDRMLDITRVLKVVDTRTYEEGPDDRFFPIIGSGIERCCDRCGRTHEIHAHVELRNGDQAIVGTGCSAGTNLELAAQFRQGTNLTKRLAVLDAQAAAFSSKVDRWDAAFKTILAMPVPAFETVPWPTPAGPRAELLCRPGGMAIIDPVRYANDAKYRDERQRCAVDGWQRTRLTELGLPWWRPRASVDFDRKRRSITRAMKILFETPAAPVAITSETETEHTQPRLRAPKL